MTDRPLAIDLFTGLHGWAEGLIDAGFYVIGFDLEDMSAQLSEAKPEHFSLVIQDVLTIHGAQLKDAHFIASSSPCQKYSYMAMPFKRGKAIAAEIRADLTGQKLRELNKLFDAQFRIQREASAAAGRHVPMVCENVRGANDWVGRSRWNCGSMHFWGDVPALMPNFKHVKVQAFRFDGSGRSFQSASVRHHGLPEGVRPTSLAWGNESRWFNDGPRNPDSISSSSSSSPARKAASAMIAKIPFEISSHIARVYRP